MTDSFRVDSFTEGLVEAAFTESMYRTTSVIEAVSDTSGSMELPETFEALVLDVVANTDVRYRTAIAVALLVTELGWSYDRGPKARSAIVGDSRAMEAGGPFVTLS